MQLAFCMQHALQLVAGTRCYRVPSSPAPIELTSQCITHFATPSCTCDCLRQRLSSGWASSTSTGERCIDGFSCCLGLSSGITTTCSLGYSLGSSLGIATGGSISNSLKEVQKDQQQP